MDGFKARKFRVSDQEVGRVISLGKGRHVCTVERRRKEEVFHNAAFWERWNTDESREMYVKLSTLSTDICGKTGVIPVNSGNFSGENQSKKAEFCRNGVDCGGIMSFFGVKVIPIFHNAMLKTVECLCGYVDD